MYDIRKKFSIGDLVTNSDLFKNAVDAGVLNPNNVSLQDFDSFVVTNPDLVDPGIDVSGLRTTTDASILGNIPDYGGIQYEAYNPNRLSDLMRLYGGGFPMLNTDTAQIPGAIDTLIDAGGGGEQATSGLGLDNTTITGETNLNDYDQGDMSLADVINNDANVGFATDPVDTYTSPTANVAPDGTTMAGVEGYLDGINLDNTFAGTPVNTPSGNNPFGYEDPQSLAIGPSGAVDFGTGGLEDEGQAVGEEFADTPVSTPSGNNPFGYEDLNPSALASPGINETSGLDDIGADIGVDNTVDYGMPQGSPGQLNPAAPSIDNITTDFSPPNIGEISGPATMTVDELAASSADQGLEAFDPSAVSQAFTEGKQAIASGISTVAEVGQSIANTIGGIYNGVDQTVSVFGREINVPATLGGIALSQLVGAPINIAFGVAKAIGGMLPEGGRSDLSDALGGEYGMDDIGRLTSGPMAGYSVDSAFGDISQAARDRAATIEDTISRLGFTEERQAKIDELNAFADKADGIEGDIDQDATPADIDAESYSGDASVAEDAEAGGRQGALDARDSLAGVDTGDAGVAEAAAAADREAAATAASNAASVSRGAAMHGGGNGGNGGNGGGGTHVCTASYANGFITQPDFKILKKYGIFLRRNDPYLMKAYDWFGPKLANKVKNGKLFNFAKHSTNMWKYNQTKQKNVSFNIKFMSAVHKIITRPILRVIGVVLKLTEKFIK